jgi:HEPN domain-containing protein
MTNYERAQSLKRRAEICIEEMERAMAQKDWNLTIRRAQEATELYMKALLKIMNVEFPKIHNVAPILVQKLKEKELLEEESMGEKLISISSDLAKKRAPAFYQEIEYSEEEAVRAKEDIYWIKKTFSELWSKLI